ncbi:hypothetical protein SLS55_007629 [Diplodia seriata]|uniref:JmjC domain-containing protein n=1 Tax=Diplodia seriata TaxID=420778 RepID=A0ABR3C896_9PEZI
MAQLMVGQAASTATDWPIELLKACIDDAVQMKRCINQLLTQVENLIKNLEKQAKLPSQRRGEGLLSRQLPESDGCYTRTIKLELAQLNAQTVPTIRKIVEGFPRCKELGYCKVAVGGDVVRNTNLHKISGSRINELHGLQSTTLHLVPRKKGDPLYGLACSSLIDGNDQASSFRVPDLLQPGEALDARELLLSTVRDARRGEGQSYLVMPAESCPRWLYSLGLIPELLDCGEQLKRTVSWIPGIHTAYLYISACRGSNSPLHVEDGFLGSVNIVLAGAPKVWLMIEPCYRRELEHKAKCYLVKDKRKREEEEHEGQGQDQSKECSQFVRHLSTLLSPKLLDAWDIPYRIVSCAAGEMVVTFSETYHQVVNAGPNLAVAINFAESEWTGPPEGYRFCRREEGKCGAHSIMPAQLQVRQPSCDSDHGTTEESQARTPSQALNAPGGPDEHPSSAFLSVESFGAFGQAPSEGPETPGALGDHPTNTQTTPEPPETLSALPGCSPDTRIPSEASETPESSSGQSRGISTPPTTLTEEEVHQDGKAGHERAYDRNAIDVIVISSDDEDDMTDDVELPLDGPSTETTVGETVATRLNHRIEQVLRFVNGLGTSRKTIECFRLNSELNDDAIVLTLQKLLPERVEILIASHAIRHVPAPGISCQNATAGVQIALPTLVHKPSSSHLCIACNVESDSLECVWEGSGNHWILVIVDFVGKRVHVFGNEGGHHEKAKALACNIGNFVNNHRIANGLSAVCWSAPETYPVTFQGLLLLLYC